MTKNRLIIRLPSIAARLAAIRFCAKPRQPLGDAHLPNGRRDALKNRTLL
jgi:hypothetical protein